MDKAAEAARLGAIRGRIAMLDGHQWLLGADGADMIVDARGPDGSLVTIARFTGHASTDEFQLMAAALDDGRFLLGLLDRATRKIHDLTGTVRKPAPAEPRKPDHTTEAAMLCDDPAFKRFLMDLHGLESPASKERTAQKLRGLLAITSRREINEDEAVRDRWIALRGEFQAWKGRARG